MFNFEVFLDFFRETTIDHCTRKYFWRQKLTRTGNFLNSVFISPESRSQTCQRWISTRERSCRRQATKPVPAAAGIHSGSDWSCSDSLDRLSSDLSCLRRRCCCHSCYYCWEIHLMPDFSGDSRSSSLTSVENCCQTMGHALAKNPNSSLNFAVVDECSMTDLFFVSFQIKTFLHFLCLWNIIFCFLSLRFHI